MKSIRSLTVLFSSLMLIFSAAGLSHAQDTLNISLEQFIERGVENSGQVDFERQSVRLAENDIDKVRARRFLPKFELNTQHGVVPGVKSDTDLPDDQLYLDPELENDWENWAITTRAEILAIQPIFSFGALSNAVEAAKAGAEAAQYKFRASQADIRIRLFELYHSYVLALEMDRLLEEATDKIEDIDEKIKEQQEEGDPDLDESDVYKFKIFKSEFSIRTAEVRENIQYIRNVWNYVLQTSSDIVYLPRDNFLDPVKNSIDSIDFYRNQALENRNELKGIDAGIAAAEHGIKATRAQNLPTFFLGLTGSFADTPNRPRQSNPFIINNTNFASAAVGFGIRQNLDFFSAKTEIEHRKIQYRRAKFLKDAAVDGIVLEVNEKYKQATLSEIKVQKLDEALVTSKEWLRQEQLDYDFGIGDTKDLIDAMKKEMELRVQLKQQIFDFNKNMAELFNVSGLPLTSLNMQ